MRRAPQAGAGAVRCGRRGGGGRFLPLPLPGPDSSLGGGTGLAPRPARAAAWPRPRPRERGQGTRLSAARAPKARDPVSSGPDPPSFPLTPPPRANPEPGQRTWWDLAASRPPPPSLG